MDFRKELEGIFDKQSHGEQSYIYDSELCWFINDVLIPNKLMIPTLYRYSPADYNNIRALEKQTLFLSESGSMNDVFEGLSCGISNDKDLKYIDSLHDLAYLKSFTENANDLIMWGTYADSYKGMCVAYDCTCFVDKTLYHHLFPVRYSDMRATKANLQNIAKELCDFNWNVAEGNSPADVDSLKDVMGLFVCKSRAWEREREWRMIVTHLQMHTQFGDYDDDDDNALLYNINSQEIVFPYAREILLGPRMRGAVKEHLHEIGKKLNIPVREMVLKKDEYALAEIETGDVDPKTV